MAFGVLLFGERPSPMMLTGAALIIASGVYLILRQKQVESAAQRRPTRTDQSPIQSDQPKNGRWTSHGE